MSEIDKEFALIDSVTEEQIAKLRQHAEWAKEYIRQNPRYTVAYNEKTGLFLTARPVS